MVPVTSAARGDATHAQTVTVVIPCFNDGHFLIDAVASVMAQTRVPDEVVIVNDGSTDRRTREILDEMRTRTGIVVMNLENRGLPGARNAGLRSAASDYVYFLDADNILKPHCIESLMGLVESEPDAAAAYGRVEVLGGDLDGQVTGSLPNAYEILVRNLWDAGILLRRAAAFENGFFYDENMRDGYEDWELHIRLVLSGKPILFCDSALYFYRVRTTSLLSHARRRHESILAYLRTKHAELYEAGKLITRKRRFAPAIGVSGEAQDGPEIGKIMERQTFRDWVISDAGSHTPYELNITDMRLFALLPAEAVEAAMLRFQAERDVDRCIIAVAATSLEPAAGDREEVYEAAILSRRQSANQGTGPRVNAEAILRFDPATSAEPGGKPVRVHSLRTNRAGWDVLTRRRRVSKRLRGILGDRTVRALTRQYNRIYGVLYSDRFMRFRAGVERRMGGKVLSLLDRFLYGLIVAPVPTMRIIRERAERFATRKISKPLFLEARREGVVNLMIATGALAGGARGTALLAILRTLDPTRVNVLVVTTDASRHPATATVRHAGVHVFHLDELVGPDKIASGLAHFVANKNIDCLIVQDSARAREATRFLQEQSPGLAILELTGPAEKAGVPAETEDPGVDVATRLRELLAGKSGIDTNRGGEESTVLRPPHLSYF